MSTKTVFEMLRQRRLAAGYSLTGQRISAPLTLDQEIIRAWKNSPEIRREFGTLKCYSAFRRAESKGLVKIVKGGAITAIKP